MVRLGFRGGVGAMGSGGGPARLVGWPVSWAVAQWGVGAFSLFSCLTLFLCLVFSFFLFYFCSFLFQFYKN